MNALWLLIFFIAGSLFGWFMRQATKDDEE
jgi:hypothetical protein